MGRTSVDQGLRTDALHYPVPEHHQRNVVISGGGPKVGWLSPRTVLEALSYAGVLRHTRIGRIAWIRFNRPTKLNAMNKQLLDGFSAAVQELAAEPDVSVLPVTGDDQAIATPPTGRRPGDPQDVLSRATASNMARPLWRHTERGE